MLRGLEYTIIARAGARLDEDFGRDTFASAWSEEYLEVSFPSFPDRTNSGS